MFSLSLQDYSLSAHYEHTVAVTRDGYKILTSSLKGGENGEE